eukprot:TRINITY_DN1925_c0_g1_i2.p1 TRINITY_DN1925_c0_g1~~TRINITY_DN1925_c0_g1_i2.p1  ORF type:complete len:264 (-),score=62.65 TRINITY_DN1925_c0_g1_i2:9-800(-)
MGFQLVWIDYATTAVVALVLGLVELLGEPVKRDFLLNDIDISYPHYEKQTVPVPELMLISVFAPAVVICAGHFLVNYYFAPRRSARLAFRLLGFAQAILLTLLLTDTIKLVVGRLRPDFLDRCQPDDQLVCQGDPDVVKEGRKSFPSGHSSLAAAGMMYLSLYLAFELQIYTPRRAAPGKQPHEIQPLAFTTFIFVVFPLLVAGIVCGTRVSDNWHHPTDVVGGALLGSATAYGVFRLHHQHGHAAESAHTALEASEQDRLNA